MLISIDSGVAVPVWEYFAAPPANVTSMNVVLPGGSPTIRNVPVITGSPKQALE